MSKWYLEQGANSDVVLWSKIRIARNLAAAPFPARMSRELQKNITKKIYATIKSSDFAGDFDMINLSEKSKVERVAYLEKQLVSKEFAVGAEIKPNSFMLSKDENLSIMICEEDHIRILSFAPGLDLESAYKKADETDNVFVNNMKLAYSKDLGFLTSSPINLGTALKASVALHLPALSRKNAIYKLSAMVGKLGLSLRQLHKNAAGDIYILSNQVSLGISEKSAIDNINAISEQIIKQERSAREELKENIDFEDKIYRTLGILKTARKLELEEFLNSLSLLRLGISYGYFDTAYETVSEMMFGLQNANLVKSSKAELSELACAKLRAQIVRDKLE